MKRKIFGAVLLLLLSMPVWAQQVKVSYEYPAHSLSVPLQEYFQMQGVQHLRLTIRGAPTEQNPSWQVDIAKGKNISHCGFVQYQYSQKVEMKKFQRLSKVKIVKNLQKYLVAKESKTLQKADLSWKCESYFNH